MKLRSFALIIFLTIIIGIITYIFGIPLNKFQKKKTNKVTLGENYIRNLDRNNEYDTMIILYFKEDCNYSTGFKNNYRKIISFIINRENNTKLTSQEELIIHTGFGIEIHFNASVKDLKYFFSTSYDYRMQYLQSIDFSYFDSSLLTNMQSMFSGCSSLKSIEF